MQRRKISRVKVTENRLSWTRYRKTYRKGKCVITNLSRFKNLTTQLKTTIIKTLLIPVIEYPPVPQCSISKTQTIHFQKVLNRGLRFIHRNEAENQNIEQLNHKYQIMPINLSVRNKAYKTWERVKYIEDNEYEELVRERESTHNWCPKTTSIINLPPPNPIYTSQS